MGEARPCVVWLTGISGAGKSTVAGLVAERLDDIGRRAYVLDGDRVRRGLSRDLGYSDADRVENVRRAAEVAALLVDAGLIVVTAFISPFAAERAMARARFAEEAFVEVHIDTALEVAEARDTKGLYARARRGEIRNFTGIDSPYEAPEDPEIRIDTQRTSAVAAADEIMGFLRKRGILYD